MGNKVFVVNDSGHDFSAAGRFGHLVILTEGSVNVFATDRLAHELRTKLNHSTPKDYLLITGSSLASAISFHDLMLRHKQVNLLIYSFRNKDYELRTIRDTQFLKGGL